MGGVGLENVVAVVGVEDVAVAEGVGGVVIVEGVGVAEGDGMEGTANKEALAGGGVEILGRVPVLPKAEGVTVCFGAGEPKKNSNTSCWRVGVGESFCELWCLGSFSSSSRSSSVSPAGFSATCCTLEAFRDFGLSSLVDVAPLLEYFANQFMRSGTGV